ncbi:MAG TPA: outer membrane beta-barrel protein [bacterium]|nr:outer membrane beta-barrel protein [bacterium]
MNRWIGAVVVAAGIALSAGTASAKDLTGRVGVGYTTTAPGSSFAPGFSGLSARYWVNEQIGLEGNLGVLLISPKGGDASNNFALGLNGYYSFINEPNLKLYGDAGLTFGSLGLTVPNGATGTTTKSETLLGFQAGMGMEFFFVGMPNLGFTTQVGLNYTSVSDFGSEISVGGGDFATFGVRYYFGGPKGPAQ